MLNKGVYSEKPYKTLLKTKTISESISCDASGILQEEHSKENLLRHSTGT